MLNPHWSIKLIKPWLSNGGLIWFNNVQLCILGANRSQFSFKLSAKPSQCTTALQHSWPLSEPHPLSPLPFRLHCRSPAKPEKMRLAPVRIVDVCGCLMDVWWMLNGCWMDGEWHWIDAWCTPNPQNAPLFDVWECSGLQGITAVTLVSLTFCCKTWHLKICEQKNHTDSDSIYSISSLLLDWSARPTLQAISTNDLDSCSSEQNKDNSGTSFFFVSSTGRLHRFRIFNIPEDIGIATREETQIPSCFYPLVI